MPDQKKANETPAKKQHDSARKINEDFSENTRQTPVDITDSIAPPPRNKGEKND